MAVTYRASSSGGGTSGTTDRTCVAPALAAGDLLVVFCNATTNTNDTPTCSDNNADGFGGSSGWTFIGKQNFAASAGRMSCFVRNALISNTGSTTITVATGSNTSGNIVCVAVAGMKRGGANGAVRQFNGQADQAASTTPAPAFSSAALTGNMTIGCVSNSATPAGVTEPTGWTERQDVGQATPNCGMEVVTRDSGFTGTTVTWGSTSTAFASFIIELDSTSLTLAAANASFTLTGQGAVLKTAITAGTGIFTLNGQSATLKKGRTLVAGTGSFAITWPAAYLRYRVKAAPSGFYQLLTAAGGDFLHWLNLASSLDYPFLDGYRGRTGVWNIWPNSASDTPNWAPVDDALTIVVPKHKKLGLSFSLGTSSPGWIYDEAPTVPRFFIDTADTAPNESFTDGVFNGTTTITSATAYFVAATDVNLSITGTGIPGGATILAVNSPTSITISAATTTSGSGKTFTLVTRPQTQPIIWDENYLTKIKPLIFAIGDRYDSNPDVAYIVATMFMQNVEMYVSKTSADTALWDAQATAYGFANRQVAYLYAAKKIVGWWLQAFPNTPVYITSVLKVFVGDTLHNDCAELLEAWITDNSTNHERGLMIASQHATQAPHDPPTQVPYAAICQAIDDSSDQSRFYAPEGSPPVPPTTDPTTVQDLIQAALTAGYQALEIYTPDIQNAANASMLATYRSIMRAQTFNQLNSDPGIFTLNGQPAILRKGRTLIAANGSFTLTGQGVTLKTAITAGTGIFTLTGQGVTLKTAITAGTGVFTLSGQGVTLRVGLQAATGIFTLSGQPAILARGLRLIAANGSFTLAGQGAVLGTAITAATGIFNLNGQGAILSVGLQAATGIFTLSGQSAILTRGLRLIASNGSFTLSGQGVVLATSLQAGTGIFTLTGQGAILGTAITAATGIFTLNGQAADLRVTAANKLFSDPGIFTLTGIASTPLVLRDLPAGTGIFVLTGQGVTLSTSISAGTGIFTLNGQPADLRKTAAATLVSGTGIFVLTGQQATLLALRDLPAATGTFVLSGQSINLIKGFGLGAATASFTLSGQPADLRATRQMQSAPGVFVLSGSSAGLAHGFTGSLQTGFFTLSGQSASFRAGRGFTANCGVFILSGMPVEMFKASPAGEINLVGLVLQVNVMTDDPPDQTSLSDDEPPDKTSLVQSASLVVKTSGKTLVLP